ncbi:MAG TPA: MarR family transcriptional regulator [Allosphingosinicella sp.]|nr:MarR family transcriptional regulator [Allosphingosinicella sp.]
MRLLRREDEASALTGPRLSALSVIVFAGPVTMAELAAAEQVRAPTMTRIVDALVADGLADRIADPSDRRLVRVGATDKGKELLEAGRRRRVRALTDRLGRLAESERRALERGVEILERLTR